MSRCDEWCGHTGLLHIIEIDGNFTKLTISMHLGTTNLDFEVKRHKHKNDGKEHNYYMIKGNWNTDTAERSSMKSTIKRKSWRAANSSWQKYLASDAHQCLWISLTADTVCLTNVYLVAVDHEYYCCWCWRCHIPKKRLRLMSLAMRRCMKIQRPVICRP